MKSKLTLRLDKKLINRAKKYAKSRNTSVSQLVADYFNAIGSPAGEKNFTADLPPITSSLLGVLEGSSVTEDDYKAHLEEKNLK